MDYPQTVAFTLTIDVLCYGISRSEEPKYEDGPAKAKQRGCLPAHHRTI